MLDGSRIRERIRLGEDSMTEFKSVAATDFLRTAKKAKGLVEGITHCISGFANTGGGWILLGVEDDGRVTGTGTREQSDDLMRRVSDLCAAIEPPISCPLHKAEVEGMPLLVVDVPAFGPGRPYRGGREYFVRDGNRTRVARRDELKRLLESADYHYDEQPIAGAAWKDIDLPAARQFLRSAYAAAAGAELDEAQVKSYLRRLRCIDQGEVPTVVGVLVFSAEPTRWLPDARVSAVRIRGTALRAEFSDHKEITGTLPQQAEAATAFLDDQLRSPSRVQGWKRTEEGVPPDVRIPREALREAIRNALMHRDYRAASQTRVFILDDRVEIINPGGLLNQLTLDSIRLGGISQHRNPTIAGLLNRVLGRETLGIGIPEMIRLMVDAGLPEPDFDTSAGQFRVILRTIPPGAL